MMEITKLTRESRDALLENLAGRNAEDTRAQEEAARAIIADIRREGDEALFRYEQKFDRCTLTKETVRVSREEIDAAYAALDPAFVEVLRKAAENIRVFHEKQIRQSWITTSEDGAILGQKITPVGISGCYVPGGRAAYPSSVLMNVVPAKVAGVKRIIITTP